MRIERRTFLRRGLGGAVATALPFLVRSAQTIETAGSAKLSVVSDGNLVLPKSFLKPPEMTEDEFVAMNNIPAVDGDFYRPACNLTLWEHAGKRILFDVGAGDSFMDSTGKMLESLDDHGVSPDSITDVVITHAHPDHLWGLVDDFDELVFVNARYHIHEIEWDFWSDRSTIDKMPENRKVFAVGAKNRFDYLTDNIELFKNGDEILPGVEVLHTPGHTPGHSSFVLHSGSSATMVVGDALTNQVFAFQPHKWRSGSDQDGHQAQQTRIHLLDRLSHEKMMLVGFHLSYPGIGFAEQAGSDYVYVPL